MSQQNGRRGNCAKYIQLVQSVWAESRACTRIYWNIVYWRDFLLLPTGSAVYIWRNISLSSILRAHLYTTPSSMGETIN